MFSPDGNLYKTMSTLFDILMIGILWFLCCLPLITVGAGTTAAYYTMSKVVRFKTGYLFKEFWRSFKTNFKQSLIPTIITQLVIVVLVLDIYYVWNNRSKLNDSLFIILSGVTFLFLACATYFGPFLSRFTKKNFALFKMAAYGAFRFLPITVLILVVFVVMVIGIYLLPWAIVVFPGLFMYLLTYPMEYVMRRFMKRPKEGEPGYDAWYWGETNDETPVHEEVTPLKMRIEAPVVATRVIETPEVETSEDEAPENEVSEKEAETQVTADDRITDSK